ncbi:MAG: hypothetical protein H0T59_10370 [Chloroflexi bacterium]|nr:hypothetical protein [Chloroflexota bacterium]
MAMRSGLRRHKIGAQLGAAAGILVLALAAAAPASATHTHGTLDCGSAGVYETEPASEVWPQPFEAPGPWSGLFLLEGTTKVFKAFVIETPQWTLRRPASAVHDMLTCTLASSGPMFSEPWRLQGVLRP